MAESTDDKILENALAPKKVTGDSGSVEQHPIADQLLAAQNVANNRAARVGLGIRHVKLVPPGGGD